MKNKKNDLFSLMPIMIGSFFGGPLAATYYLAHNFTVLNKSDESKKTLLWGISITVILFVGIFFIPDNFADNMRHVIPIVYLIVTKMIYSMYQNDFIKRHLEEREAFKKASAIKSILVSLICLVISVVYFTIIALIIE